MANLETCYSDLSTVCRFDDVRDVLALIHAKRLRIDPAYAGEVSRLFENPGLRLNYQSANGLDVDSMAEALWDAGFTTRRMDCRETLDFLEMVFTPRLPVHKSRVRVARAEIDPALRRAKSTRNRAYVCPSCSRLIHGNRDTYALCGHCYENDPEHPQVMQLRDMLPEQIEAEILRTAATEAA